MNIVAVDPGKRCGLAFLRSRYMVSHEDGPVSAVVYVETLVDGGIADVVVCESFIPRPGVRTWQPDAIETIGALRYVCHRAGVVFELQDPASAKRFSTNDKLALLGWRNPTRGGHADDAARHLLLAAVRYGVVDPEQFVPAT